MFEDVRVWGRRRRWEAVRRFKTSILKVRLAIIRAFDPRIEMSYLDFEPLMITRSSCSLVGLNSRDHSK